MAAISDYLKSVSTEISENRNGLNSGNPEKGYMPFLDLIIKGLKKPGKSKGGLAAALGRTPSTVTAILNGTREIKARELDVIRDYLEMSEDEIGPVNHTAKPLRKNLGEAGTIPKIGAATVNRTIPAAELVGARDLPVFAAAQGGKGAIVVSTDPIEWVGRPEPLASVKDGYGIIIIEESMFPAFEPGDIALVHPHLPPTAGKTCIFYCEQPDGTVVVSIKRLRKVTADAWHVQQWNPPEGAKAEFTMKKSEWQKAHVVVGKYSRR